MNHVSLLHVMCAGMKVGTLAQGRGREVVFQYDADWLRHGFDLAPGQMNFNATPQIALDTRLFDGLHGAFADSLPDNWGKLLMNRALSQRAGWAEERITPMDRLAYIGNRGMGALEYHPVLPDSQVMAPMDWQELERMGAEAQRILAGHMKETGRAGQVLESLRVHGGSPGGARPKVLIAFSKDTGLCHSSLEPLQPGFTHWLVKFRGPLDPLDMGAIEFTYSEMAHEAGVRAPPSALIPLRNGLAWEQVFAVERFDREADEKLHVLTLAGYAYADFESPTLDYDEVLGATMAITCDHQEVEQAFRLMVFNVLAHNQDDHAKNFSFRRHHGRWYLAPAYDLTFSVVRGAHRPEHWTTVANNGLPGRKDVMKVARSHGVRQPEQIIEQVRAAVADWPRLAKRNHVSAESSSRIASALADVGRRF